MDFVHMLLKIKEQISVRYVVLEIWRVWAPESVLRRDGASEVVGKIVHVFKVAASRNQERWKTSEEEMCEISSDAKKEKKPDSEGGGRVWRLEWRKAPVCSGAPLPL